MKLRHMMSALLISVLMTSCAEPLPPIIVDKSQDVIYIDVDINATAPHSGWLITDDKLAKILMLKPQ